MYSTFKAFPGSLPINRKRSYFVGDGKVRCHHPYWPLDAFESYSGSLSQYELELKLSALNFESDEEVAYLTGMAEKVSDAIPGEWSLDFSMDNNGKWWAIDMAEAFKSYHWPDCKLGIVTCHKFAKFLL